MTDFILKAKLFARTLLRNRLMHIGALFLLVFTAIEIYQGDEVTRIAFESARIAVFAVMSCVTFIAAMNSFWTGAQRGAEQMALAIFGLSTAIFLHAIWVPVARYLTTPDWLNENVITTFMIGLIALSGLGYLIPILTRRRSELPIVGSWGAIALCFFLTGLICGGALTVGLSLG